MTSLLPKTILNDEQDSIEGILLINKPKGKTSFSLVAILRRLLGVKKIGHAGTLDPFATGVMVMLIGRRYTRLSDRFLTCDKEYVAEAFLGVSTDTYDCEGEVRSRSDLQPTLEDIQEALKLFQGEINQIPPMYSAKKIGGKKLYELARKGQEVERAPVAVQVDSRLVSYQYPYVELHVKCSKGTYIRSLAHDLGQTLGCGAHLTNLKRVRSGSFSLDACVDLADLQDGAVDIKSRLIKVPD